jgi:hypothetical protein
MLKHVIVEGCDGSGKTTLVMKLSQTFGWPVHTRASTSLGGPVPNVDDWALEDVNTMYKQEPSIYDRHPCISESIYAPIVRHVKPMGKLSDETFTTTVREIAAHFAVLVVCLPPFSFVRRNVFDEGPGTGGQMIGVQDNLHALYSAYKRVGQMWPGVIIWWNGWQSTQYDYNNLTSNIRAHMRGDFDVR